MSGDARTECRAERLWDDLGTPLLPHVDCPVCRDSAEVYSHFDRAGCYLCHWKGSLTAMRAAAPFQRQRLEVDDGRY